MKKWRTSLLVICVSILLGWVLGYLRLPSIQTSFYFIGSLCLLTLILSLTVVLVIKVMGLKRKVTTGIVANEKSVVWAVSLGILLLLSLCLNFLLYREYLSLDQKAADQERSIKKQAFLIESSKKDSQLTMLYSFLKEIELELDTTKDRSLKKETIDKIVAFSEVLEPFNYFPEDTSDKGLRSPGRGQLLKSLLLLQLDSTSFKKIIAGVNFTFADLEKAELSHLNLSGIDLKGAHLKLATMKGVKLIGSNLSEASLWNANLNGSDLRKAKFINADLSWAEINKADLRECNFSGANLINAKLRGSLMKKAILKWTDMKGAMLNGSNMEEADLFSAVLDNVSLKDANLKNSRMRNTSLQGANLEGSNLFNAAVEKNWLDKLTNWNVSGRIELIKKYEVIEDGSEKFKNDKHFLKIVE